MDKILRVMVLCLCSFLLMGCWPSIDVRSEAQVQIDKSLSTQQVLNSINPGDKILVQTRTSGKRNLIVSAITETHIETAYNQYPLDETEVLAVYLPKSPPTIAEGVASILAFPVLIYVLFVMPL